MSALKIEFESIKDLTNELKTKLHDLGDDFTEYVKSQTNVAFGSDTNKDQDTNDNEYNY